MRRVREMARLVVSMVIAMIVVMRIDVMFFDHESFLAVERQIEQPERVQRRHEHPAQHRIISVGECSAAMLIASLE